MFLQFTLDRQRVANRRSNNNLLKTIEENQSSVNRVFGKAKENK